MGRIVVQRTPRQEHRAIKTSKKPSNVVFPLEILCVFDLCDLCVSVVRSFFWELLVLEYLLFALACLGHAYLLTVLLNVVYAQPWQRYLLKSVRALVAFLILGGPFVFIAAYGFALTPILEATFFV